MWILKGAGLIRRRRLFEVRRLLEEIRYLNQMNFECYYRKSICMLCIEYLVT